MRSPLTKMESSSQVTYTNSQPFCLQRCYFDTRNSQYPAVSRLSYTALSILSVNNPPPSPQPQWHTTTAQPHSEDSSLYLPMFSIKKTAESHNFAKTAQARYLFPQPQHTRCAMTPSTTASNLAFARILPPIIPALSSILGSACTLRRYLFENPPIRWSEKCMLDDARAGKRLNRAKRSAGWRTTNGA
jgi:hypothetical protein